MIRSHFAGGVSEQGDICKKAVSKGWCKESRLYCNHFKHRPNDPFCWEILQTLGIESTLQPTVKFLNFQMPEIFAVFYLKFKLKAQPLGYFVKKMQMEKQTVKTLIIEEQSELGLHCLPRPICPKT